MTKKRPIRFWDADRFVREEVAAVVEEFERELVGSGHVPDRRKLLLSRVRILLQIVGGVLLGVNVAFGGLLVIFFIVNRVLHIEF